MKDVYTALITPFKKDLSIDYEALDRMSDKLINEGERNFVLLGTTAECSLLKETEKMNIVKHFCHRNKNVNVIVGICSNNTVEVIRQIEMMSMLKNIKAFLVVVPYYLNPNQKGIFKHFDMICSSTDRSIMIYDIPKRTNVSIDVNTVVLLKKKHSHIIGIKLCGCINKVRELKTIDHFLVYMGDDNLLLEGLKEGADGVISVCSHIDYQLVSDICEYQKVEDDCKLKKLSYKVFIEPSPSPIKYILSQLGYIENKVRSPYVIIDNDHRAVLDRVVEFYKKDLKHM